MYIPTRICGSALVRFIFLFSFSRNRSARDCGSCHWQRRQVYQRLGVLIAVKLKFLPHKRGSPAPREDAPRGLKTRITLYFRAKSDHFQKVSLRITFRTITRMYETRPQEFFFRTASYGDLEMIFLGGNINGDPTSERLFRVYELRDNSNNPADRQARLRIYVLRNSRPIITIRECSRERLRPAPLSLTIRHSKVQTQSTRCGNVDALT